MALKLGSMVGFTDEELKQLSFDLSECNRALAAPSFKEQLMACTFDNTDDTNEQIWAKLSADITVTQETMANLGFWATHYDHTIAEEEDELVTCNRPLYDTESSPARSNTQFHEGCHAAGFSHRSATDYLSVPYQAGNVMQAWLEANPLPTAPLENVA